MKNVLSIIKSISLLGTMGLLAVLIMSNKKRLGRGDETVDVNCAGIISVASADYIDPGYFRIKNITDSIITLRVQLSEDDSAHTWKFFPGNNPEVVLKIQKSDINSITSIYIMK